MRKHLHIVAALALAGVLACGKGEAGKTAAADSTGRDLQLAPADSTQALNDKPAPAETPAAAPAAAPAPAPAPKPVAPKPRPAASAPAPAPAAKPALSLAAGTSVQAEVTDSIDSAKQKAGDVVTLKVSEDVKDAKGRTVIPAGSTVSLRIEAIKWSENKGDKGTLTVTPTAVTINGERHPLDDAKATLPAFSYRKRGGALGDASKVAGGAAAGAVVGGLLGKGKGAVIGGLIGGAVGTQRAIETKDRDIIIPPGSTIAIELPNGFTR